MPSKEINDVLAVEELVHEIKENLRLKARPSHSHGRNSRPSPYHIPCRSWNEYHYPQEQQPCNNPNCTATLNSNSSSTVQQYQQQQQSFDIQQQQRQQQIMIVGCGTNNIINTKNCNCNTILSNNTCEKISNCINFNNKCCCCNNKNNQYNHHHHNDNHNHQHHHHNNKNNSVDDIDDPYELLQVLIKNQNLVKEAVRRLQLNISPKQRYFYESDDDGSTSSPPQIYSGRVCELEL